MNGKLEFPQLETDRAVLRILTYDDIDTVFPHFSNAEVTRYIDTYPVTKTDEVKGLIDWGKSLFKHKRGLFWGIYRKEDNSFLGSVNYVARQDNNFTRTVHRAEIGYDLSPQYWGRGYMFEALRSVIRYIFADTCIDRIEATIRPENIRSHNVVLRAGFQKEGVLRQYVLWEGQHLDFVLYSLLKNEWQATR